MISWPMVLVSPLLAITSANWLVIWVFLEISTFSFLSILKNKKNSESMMKYFMVQTMSSIVLLLSVSVNMGLESFEVDSFYLPPILILSLMVKSGVAPTHVWMPSVIQSMPWVGVLLLLTAQKLAPLYLMVKNSAMEQMIMIMLLSSILGTFSQLSSLNVKTILMYSSVAHSSWMLLAGFLKVKLFALYYMTYALILWAILALCKGSKINSLTNPSKNSDLAISFLSFSGAPPLLGFIPKLFVLMEALKMAYLNVVLIIMILMNCLNTFIYMRMFMLKTANIPHSLKNTPSLKIKSTFSMWSKMLNFSPALILVLFML